MDSISWESKTDKPLKRRGKNLHDHLQENLCDIHKVVKLSNLYMGTQSHIQHSSVRAK